MIIPQHLQHFPQPTLLILSDHVQAKFFVAHNDTLTEVDGIDMPPSPPPTMPGETMNTSNDVENHRFGHFVGAVCGKTKELIDAHNTDAIHLVMPMDVEHALIEKCPLELQTRVQKKLRLNLMKEGLVDVLKWLFPEQS